MLFAAISKPLQLLCVYSHRTTASILQDVIVSERRFQYEAEVKANPTNYESWFDYIRLEESAGDHDKVIWLLHAVPARKHCNKRSTAGPDLQGQMPSGQTQDVAALDCQATPTLYFLQLCWTEFKACIEGEGRL